jgi:hypothetical protein
MHPERARLRSYLMNLRQEAEPSGQIQQMEVALEILGNLLYLAKLEQPGSAAQMKYLSRAQQEVASLAFALAENRSRPAAVKGSISQ